LIRTKRIATSPGLAANVVTWDDETGEAERVEYDHDGRTIRRAVVRRFPRERWVDDVVGETTWFDADDRVVRRAPVLLGRSLALD
jgi:YD repeat-containing protein